MVRAKVVDEVWLPEVPVMVRLYCPTGAELLAVNVSVAPNTVAGFGEKDAVTPLGRPDADRVTLPLNPYDGFTEMSVVPEVPWPMLRPYE